MSESWFPTVSNKTPVSYPDFRRSAADSLACKLSTYGQMKLVLQSRLNAKTFTCKIQYTRAQEALLGRTLTASSAVKREASKRKMLAEGKPEHACFVGGQPREWAG